MSNGKHDHHNRPADAKAPARYTGTTMNINDLGSDDLKYVWQQCGGDLFTIHAIVGDAEEIKARSNDAQRQGGHPREPNTQPEASVNTFNQSGYLPYTPPARIAAFVAEVNAWVKANLHTGRRERSEHHSDK
jgi:hypothetical protein